MDIDKLKVELFRYGTLVIGKVLHTPDKLRNRGEPEIVLGKLDAYKVASCRMPALMGLCLYVHGSTTYRDDYAIYYDYGTEAAADKAIAMFELIIERINKSLESEHYQTKTIATRGNYAIKSVNYPEVQGQILYVWGTNKVSDNLISSYQYSSEDEAIKAMSMFEAMIEELNKEETNEKIDCGVCPF